MNESQLLNTVMISVVWLASLVLAWNMHSLLVLAAPAVLVIHKVSSAFNQDGGGGRR